MDKAFIDYQLSAQNLRTCQTLLLQDRIKPNANNYATYILAEIYNREHAGDSKESIKQFIKIHNENIFFAMQLSGMSYTDIQLMPVDKINKYIDFFTKR